MRAQWQGMVCNTTKIWSSYYHPRKTGGNCYQTPCYWVPLFGIQALACMLVQDGHLHYIGWVIHIDMFVYSSPIEDPNHCSLFLMLILVAPYLFYVGLSRLLQLMLHDTVSASADSIKNIHLSCCRKTVRRRDLSLLYGIYPGMSRPV